MKVFIRALPQNLWVKAIAFQPAEDARFPDHSAITNLSSAPPR